MHILNIKKILSKVNKMTIDVSVIVPTYNVEQYISICLNSLIKQTLQNIEIICIDDKSTDSTRHIIKNFQKLDNRIRIYENEANRGQGFSRNIGIKNANGKYILFLDSDDWLDLNALEILFNNAEEKKTDILMFKLINYSSSANLNLSSKFSNILYDGTFYKTNYYSIKELDNFIGKVFTCNDIPFFKIANSPCNKFFLSSFLKDNDIYFPEGLIYEDNPFYFKTITNAKRISLVENHFYNRRRHEKSTIQRVDHKVLDSIEITDICLKYFLDSNLYQNYKEGILNYVILTLKQSFDKIDEKYKEKYFKLTKKKLNKFFTIYNIENDFYNYLNQDNLNFFTRIITSSEFDNIFYTPYDVTIVLEIESEKFRKSLQSVLNQNFKNIQIICLISNYTSTIINQLKEFQKNHKNIKLVTGIKNNPKKIVLHISDGKYVMFIDENTWLDPNAVEQLFNYSENNKLDLTFYNHRYFDENTFSFIENTYDTQNHFNKTSYKLKNQDISEKFPLNISNQFFKKSFLNKNCLYNIIDEELLFELNILKLTESNSFFNKDICNKIYSKKTFLNLDLYENILNKHFDKIDEVSKSFFFNKMIYDFKLYLYNEVKTNKEYKNLKNNIKRITDNSKFTKEYLNSKNYMFLNNLISSKTFMEYKKSYLNKSYIYEISIIITVYNAKSNYIKKCFESILHQTFNFNKIEIIIVDNCSSYLEGKEYITQLVNNYFNVKGIFLNKNICSSHTRNIGIQYANGKYIMFLDQNHYYLRNTCRMLYNIISLDNVDMVSGNFISHGKSKDWKEKGILEYYTKLRNINENLNLFKIHPSVYTKIYKRTFLINNKIKFRNFIAGQDLAFLYETLFNAKGIVFVDEKIIKYDIKNENNLNLNHNHINNSYKLKTLIDVYTFLLKLFKDNNPNRTDIPLNNTLPYWTIKLLFKSNLNYDEFKNLMKYGKKLFEEYLNNEKIEKNQICETLFENILDNKYDLAYEKYKIWSNCQ